MTQPPPFNLAHGHFAQHSAKDLTPVVNGQNLIDAFADCDMAQCEKMAEALDRGEYQNFGRMMMKAMQTWSAKNS